MNKLTCNSSKNLPLTLLVAFGPFIAASGAAATSLYTASNTKLRLTKQGNVVVAQDGNILNEKWHGEFALVGMSYGECPYYGCKNESYGACGFGAGRILVWTSATLADGSWSEPLEILPKESRPQNAIYFRPHVAYNPTTGKWVLWVRSLPVLGPGLSQDPTLYLSAVSDSLDGPFAIAQRNVSMYYANSADENLFVDDDAVGYLVHTARSGGRKIVVERLTSDYTQTSGNRSDGIGPGGTEAPAMFKRKGVYYVAMAHDCCFCNTGAATIVFSSTNALGPYVAAGTLGNAPKAQQNFAFPWLSDKGMLGDGNVLWSGNRWGSGPSPRDNALCEKDCKMVAEAPAGTFFSGQYNETQAHSVKSILECQQACLSSSQCVQCTWAPNHADKCVLYQLIEKQTVHHMEHVQAWVKCASNASSTAADCASFAPAPLLDHSLQYWTMLGFHENGSVKALEWQDSVAIPSTTAISARDTTHVPVLDANWYFSDYNWISDSPTAVPRMLTANPGAYFKLGFNGTSFALAVNTSVVGTRTVKLSFNVDDGPWQFVTLQSTPAGSALTTLQLAKGLTLPQMHFARTHHDIIVALYASQEQHGRWNGVKDGGSASYLVVNGAEIDADASTFPPVLLPKRALVYGDSITEGTNAQLFDFSTNKCDSQTRAGLDAAAATKSWCFGFAQAMHAEVSNCAFAAQGYSTFNSLNYGGVPPLLTLGASISSAWDKVDAAHSRLPLLRKRPPDFVISAEGFNDQVCSPGWGEKYNCTNAGLTGAVAEWLKHMRQATAASTQIFVLVPFGGELRTKNLTRNSIRAGFNAYQEMKGDSMAHLIDLYPFAKRGLMGASSPKDPSSSGQPTGPTAESCDGTHPLAQRHAELGAMAAAAAAAAMSGGSSVTGGYA